MVGNIKTLGSDLGWSEEAGGELNAGVDSGKSRANDPPNPISSLAIMCLRRHTALLNQPYDYARPGRALGFVHHRQGVE